MAGDERRRHCASCDREVVHLSAMTLEEARQALTARPGERVCVRYSCDTADNIVFAPRVRAVALATALAGCTASEAIEEPPRVPEAPVEWQACDEEDDDESGQCDEEVPPMIEVSGGVMEIEVTTLPRRSFETVTALEFRTWMGLPLGSEGGPRYLESYAAREPEEPRHVVPLDHWMGALPPDLLAGAVPRREEE